MVSVATALGVMGGVVMVGVVTDSGGGCVVMATVGVSVTIDVVVVSKGVVVCVVVVVVVVTGVVVGGCVVVCTVVTMGVVGVAVVTRAVVVLGGCVVVMVWEGVGLGGGVVWGLREDSGSRGSEVHSGLESGLRLTPRRGRLAVGMTPRGKASSASRLVGRFSAFSASSS